MIRTSKSGVEKYAIRRSGPVSILTESIRKTFRITKEDLWKWEWVNGCLANRNCSSRRIKNRFSNRQLITKPINFKLLL